MLFPRPPQLVSWGVSPHSGTPPYVLAGVFARKFLIGGGRYVFRVFSVISAGSCPAPAVSGTQSGVLESGVFNNGFSVIRLPTAVGQCRRLTGAIFDLQTNTYISVAHTFINNV